MSLWEYLWWSLFVGLLSIGVLVFVVLLWVTAPYGRFAPSRSWWWTVPARLGWFIQESPCLWVSALVLLLLAKTAALRSLTNMVLLSLFLVHYVYRSIVYPCLLVTPAPMPFYIVVCATVFCACNGFVQSFFFGYMHVYEDSWLTDPRFILGSLIWLTGLSINMHSDSVLRQLRKKRDPDGPRYLIPQRGVFRWVSAPNYLGEMIEWGGYALASWSLAGMFFFAFTVFNLFPRALSSHRWYRERFQSVFPVDRRALTPYVI
jgi:3-oxo-5-alpha-steroid 4-dehydrogenase 1